MAQSSRFIDTHKVVIAVPPSTPNTANDNTTYLLGDYINMADYNHCAVIMVGGAFTGTSVVNVYQATSAAGGSAKIISALTERFLCTATSAASDTWVATAVTSSTWTWPATNNLANIVEINARDLDIANGFQWIAVNTATSGQAGDRLCVIYILSEPRYLKAENSPSAII